MQRNYDLVIVGCGPAGMSAAITAAAQSLSVLVLDEQPEPGGQIWRHIEQNASGERAKMLGPDYKKGADLARRFRETSVDIEFGAKVWQVEDEFQVYYSKEGIAHSVACKRFLIAIGAQERPNPFHGWTLPGVMTVGAAQILMKSSGEIPKDPVWVAGSGPLTLLYIYQLLKMGGDVAGYISTTPRRNIWRAAPHFPVALTQPKGLLKGLKWITELKRSKLPIFSGCKRLAALGDDRLEEIQFEDKSKQRRTAKTNLLLVHEGVVPNIHLPLSLGCSVAWNASQKCLAPVLNGWSETTRSGVFVAGDGGGISGADAAVELGRIAAIGACRSLGVLSDAQAESQSRESRGQARRLFSIRPFLDALYEPRAEVFDPDPKTIICRCEHKTAQDIIDASKRGGADPTQVKAATRAGMGPCQGRQCGYTVSALIAKLHGVPIDKVGYFNIRAPIKPISLGEISALRETSGEALTEPSEKQKSNA